MAALSACQMAPGAGAGLDAAPVESTAATATTPAQRVIERDVEAPDVFQRQEAGL